MLATIHTSSMNGMKALPVLLEVNAYVNKFAQDTGASFFMVGLPDNAVKESRMRVSSALINTKFALPLQTSYTINFAPADVRKEGSGFDLPLAIGLLVANKIVKSDMLSRYVLVGELGLDGSIRPVKGALSIAIQARADHYEGLIVPKANEREAAVVNNLKVYGAERLSDVVAFFNGTTDALQQTIVNTREEFYQAQINTPYDFSDVKGQEAVKRAFEVAAAGGHNILIVGLARMRQKHDGQAYSFDSSAAHVGRESRNDADTLCGRQPGVNHFAHLSTPVPLAPPHDQRRCPYRRWNNV